MPTRARIQPKRRRSSRQFENFDAAKAECFLPKDRERLLAVIEAGFGDVREFNKIVRRIFAGRHTSGQAV
mgnify:CR=1 FL=1